MKAELIARRKDSYVYRIEETNEVIYSRYKYIAQVQVITKKNGDKVVIGLTADDLCISSNNELVLFKQGFQPTVLGKLY
jgi:hypothetical protein